MAKNVYLIIALLGMMGCSSGCGEMKRNPPAEHLDYEIVKGAFTTSEGVIPAGCLGQLITELNGDDTVAAIFVNCPDLRGCIDANIPYPGGDPEDISYTIKEPLRDHAYKITVRQIIHGSMGHFDSNIIIKFVNRQYVLKDGTVREVLSIEKIGEW